MIRSCFIDKSKLKKLTEYKWDIIESKKEKIGFGWCPNCDLVLQSPCLSKTKIINYYKFTSIYFENFSKPSLNHIRTTNRHINLIKKNMEYKPRNILEVGVSSDYNFKKYLSFGVKKFHGLEPSKFIIQKFRKSEFKIFNNTIENFKFKLNYDLIIFSHVIEHLYNPLESLKKCALNQNVGQHILIEVPLLEKPKFFPPCYFNMEHLNYFNLNNLKLMMGKISYEVIAFKKIYKNAEYPIITILCKKKKDLNLFLKKNNNSKFIAKKYFSSEKEFWGKKNKIFKYLDKSIPTYLYGAGLHTSMLLYKTKIEQYLNIQGIIDSSPLKNKKKFGRYRILNPKILVDLGQTNIIISTYSGEKDIFKFLKKIKNKNLKIIKLYN